MRHKAAPGGRAPSVGVVWTGGVVVFCERDGDGLLCGAHVLPQIEKQRSAFGALVERIATHVEIVGDDWFEFAAIAVGVCETPDARPVLQRAEAARQDAADTAVTAWS